MDFQDVATPEDTIPEDRGIYCTLLRIFTPT